MSINIIVCVKQVIDPDAPVASLDISEDSVVSSKEKQFVLNGYDENAVEAALKIKDDVGAEVTILSVGSYFESDVMKKPISMGADRLILVEDAKFLSLDGFSTSELLGKAINKIGEFDLVLCGRQASDWDNAYVPLVLSEILNVACVTLAQKIDVVSNRVRVERVMSGGYEVVESEFPALITVSNEIGNPRYPTIRGIMNAGRKKPDIWTSNEIDITNELVKKQPLIKNLSIPNNESDCEFVLSDSEEELGRLLAENLIENKLI